MANPYPSDNPNTGETPLNNCPHCGASLWETNKGTRYRRCIGVLDTTNLTEQQVLFTACPHCWNTWHHWPNDHPLYDHAEKNSALFREYAHKFRPDTPPNK
jgi:hypothetical protein